jgi:hypothetical protein
MQPRLMHLNMCDPAQPTFACCGSCSMYYCIYAMYRPLLSKFKCCKTINMNWKRSAHNFFKPEISIVYYSNRDMNKPTKEGRTLLPRPPSLVRTKDFVTVSSDKVVAVPRKPEITEREQADVKSRTTSEATESETEIEFDEGVQFDQGSKGFTHMTASGSNSKGSSIASSIDTTADLFNRTRLLLNPSAFYRKMMYLYAERKLVVFFGIHFVSTMIVWSK